jgi:broad specificity phosphatase PhoE
MNNFLPTPKRLRISYSIVIISSVSLCILESRSYSKNVPSACNITLVIQRHGFGEHNAVNELNSRVASPKKKLTPKGLKDDLGFDSSDQAAENKMISEINNRDMTPTNTLIYSSPLLRTRQTSAVFVHHLDQRVKTMPSQLQPSESFKQSSTQKDFLGPGMSANLALAVDSLDRRTDLFHEDPGLLERDFGPCEGTTRPHRTEGVVKATHTPTVDCYNELITQDNITDTILKTIESPLGKKTLWNLVKDRLNQNEMHTNYPTQDALMEAINSKIPDIQQNAIQAVFQSIPADKRVKKFLAEPDSSIRERVNQFIVEHLAPKMQEFCQKPPQSEPKFVYIATHDVTARILKEILDPPAEGQKVPLLNPGEFYSIANLAGHLPRSDESTTQTLCNEESKKDLSGELKDSVNKICKDFLRPGEVLR